VSKEYKSYFKKLIRLHKVFERTNKTASVNPDVFIRDVAKEYSRYFSGTRKERQLEIGYDPGSVRQRQKMIGAQLLYHSGSWSALECYRNFVVWKMTASSFDLYREIITSDEALHRGKALLSLTNTIVRIAMM
jgi:predicted RNase H-related nuclease YkuK (DUF458 family)